MKFGEVNYWHSMDRQAAQNMNASPSKIGISTPPMKDQLQSLKTRIFQGAQTVELGFLGRGKGSMAQGSTTPGMYGKDERQAMKEMAKVNKVNLQTHATLQVGSLSGFGGREETFSEDVRNQNITEVKRTMDFAADVAEGGSVTVHTGEFPRSISEQEYGKDFESYPGESEKAILYLVDKNTGQMINAIRKDQTIYAPKFDEEGNPEWDAEKKEFKLVPRTYAYYKETADDYNKEHAEEIAKNPDEERHAEKLMFKDVIKMKEDNARAWGEGYQMRVEEHLKEQEDLKKALKIYEEREADVPEHRRKELEQDFPTDNQGILPPKKQLPSQYIREKLEGIQKQILNDQDMAITHREQSAELKQKRDNAIPIAEYATKKTSESLADLGIYAMKKTESQKLPRPLFIAPENMFPEGGYGSHPSEIRSIITKARNEMTAQLKEKKVSEWKARQLADKHIKSTFDIGHAYTWKKFFKTKPGETEVEHAKRFDKWVIGEAEKLQKEGIIGKIHLSDNFGYYDEHTTPGQGNVPMNDFFQRMRKAGYDGPMIVEPDHKDHLSWTGAMRTLQSPVYRIDRTSQTWTDIEGSYFGQTRAPSYLVGEGVVPDAKEWTLWSGIPLE